MVCFYSFIAKSFPFGIDPIWVAKIEVPTNEFEAIKKTAENKPKGVIESDQKPTIKWWKPKGVIFEKQYTPTDNTIVKLIFSKEGDSFFVYIERIVF